MTAKKGGSARPITDDEVISLYEQMGSVWKVADVLNTNGQAIHRKLQKLLIDTSRNVFTKSDENTLLSEYEHYASLGQLDVLAKKLGRSKHYTCRQAKRLGLTNKNRKKAPHVVENLSRRFKEWHKTHEHPRGALGMKHSPETKKILSEKSKEMWRNMSDEMRDEYSRRGSVAGQKMAAKNGEGASWKAGWREVGDKRCYFRSQWEANYARYLEWLKQNNEIKEWEYEPETFWFEKIKRGVRSYKPDFRVTESGGRIIYHEVKGWMDGRSKTTLRRMKKYYPEVELVLIQKKEYYSIKQDIESFIKDWE